MILLAYMSLPRHIRKGVLIRRNIASDLCGTAAVSCQQFRKESKERQRRIMFERTVIISFLFLKAIGGHKSVNR